MRTSDFEIKKDEETGELYLYTYYRYLPAENVSMANRYGAEDYLATDYTVVLLQDVLDAANEPEQEPKIPN